MTRSLTNRPPTTGYPSGPMRPLAFLVAAVLALGACRQTFQASRFSSNAELYAASLHEFEEKNWENALAGFERLTLELPPRDTLASRAFWYLARTQQERKEWLLAAQSFTRLFESFAQDTLAERAMIESARSYRKLWRKPALDSEYGQTALTMYREFVLLHPQSPLVPDAQAQVAELEEWLARKGYETGMDYFRRKAFDSSIIYFRDVMRLYPSAPTSRRAGLRLAEAFRAIRYREDEAEVCALLRTQYAGDQEVLEVCGPAPAPVPEPATPAPAAPGATRP
jgi:outer membrane assembly lipoprotein YfiO